MVVGPKELSLSGQSITSATSLRIIKDSFLFFIFWFKCARSLQSIKKGKVRMEVKTAILSKDCTCTPCSLGLG